MSSKLRTELILAVIVLVICSLSVFFVNSTFVHEEEKQVVPAEKTVDLQAQNDYVEVEAEVIGIDPVAEQVTLRVRFIPHGRFDSGDGLLAVPVQIDFSDLTGSSITFEAGM